MYPFLDPADLRKLAALRLASRYPVAGHVSGRHRSWLRGSSADFASYREYAPGDDPRRLDWRAFARSDRFFVKQFEAETNLRLQLVVDASGSMQYPVAPSSSPSKWECGRRLASNLAYLAVAQGDAVGLDCVSNETAIHMSARRGTAQLRALCDRLATTGAGGEASVEDALHAVAERISPRSLVVVISDLFLDPTELNDGLRHLRFRHHDVVVFHLLERNEVAFDFEHPTRFIDLETGNATHVTPSAMRDDYKRALREYLTNVQSAAHQAAVDYHRVFNDMPVLEILAGFLAGRPVHSGDRLAPTEATGPT